MTFKRAICSFVTLSVCLSCGLQPSVQQTANVSSEKERIARFEKQIEELREKLKIPGLIEDALARALPDPRWSQSNDQFKTEVEQLVNQAGGYRYEAELVSHNSLSRWLDERRNSVRKEIKIDPKIYDQYVGQYEIEPGKAFTITKESDRLFINSVGLQKVEVFPESEDKFFLKAMETRLTFVRDSKGLVTRAEIEDEFEFRGKPMRVPKIK